jgi:quercetin dioxygenase-like cupin family protein
MKVFNYEIDNAVGPEISINSGGNIFIRRMYFSKAGMVEQGHSHTYDHVTFLERGKLGIRVAGRESIYTGPIMLKIVAGEEHLLVALEDDTAAYCIHALKDVENEEILDFNATPFLQQVPSDRYVPLTGPARKKK